jgi:hypothetical protein
MHLHAERRNVDADIGGEGFCDGREQVGALLPMRRVLRAGRHPRHVDGMGAGIGDGACGLGQRLHRQKIALHVGVMDDRRHAFARVGRRLALAAFIGISERLLERRLGNRHALNADQQAGIVHHREHAGEPAVFLADQPADSARFAALGEAVAIDHRAGRRGVDAELLLDTRAEHVVARTWRTVFVEQEFRHQKQRDAACAGRRIGQSR